LAPLDPHSPAAENTRLLTLLPLLRTTLAIVFVTLFTLSALWTLGIQIGRCWRERESLAWRSDLARKLWCGM